MPIFISYNHADRDFVDTLAENLVAAKHNVWMDRWELSLGDSLIQKIQEALTNSSAIIVVLSENSIQSEWCKKELTSGLLRELEEKKTVVMPCVIDDCDIPLFLRDKLYADFRRNPDEAFDLVDRSLAKISNPLQGRSESPKFHTDYAMDWLKGAGGWLFRWVFVDHGHEWPYVILVQCSVTCNEIANQEFEEIRGRQAKQNEFWKQILIEIRNALNGKPLSVKIENAFEKAIARTLRLKDGKEFVVQFSYRRLGEDTGMDTIVHLDNYIGIALRQIENVTFTPNSKTKARTSAARGRQRRNSETRPMT